MRVAQQCECTQCHWTVWLNMIKILILCFMLCDYCNKKKKHLKHRHSKKKKRWLSIFLEENKESGKIMSSIWSTWST